MLNCTWLLMRRICKEFYDDTVVNMIDVRRRLVTCKRQD